MAECPSAEVPEIAEEEAEGEEVEPVSPQLRELGHLRLEQQRVCKAETDRLDQVISRLWWVTAQTLALDHPEAALGEVNEWLAASAERDEKAYEDLGSIALKLTDSSAEPLRAVLDGVDGEHPLPVSGAAEGEAVLASGELASSVDAAGEGQIAALWMIAGILVGAIAAYVLYRLFERSS